MIEEGYDLVIRVNPAPDESLVGRIFLHDRLVVVAGPTLARSANKVATPAVVRGTDDRVIEWEVMTATGRTHIGVDPVLRLSSLVMVRDAVRTGVGAAQLPISLVAHDITEDTLVNWATFRARRSPFGCSTRRAGC